MSDTLVMLSDLLSVGLCGLARAQATLFEECALTLDITVHPLPGSTLLSVDSDSDDRGACLLAAGDQGLHVGHSPLQRAALDAVRDIVGRKARGNQLQHTGPHTGRVDAHRRRTALGFQAGRRV